MKKNLIAMGALVVLGVIVVIVFRDTPKEKPGPVASIHPVDGAALDTIEIKRTEGEGDEAEVEQITLKKTGDTWRMAVPVDYQIVESSARRMVDTLVDLQAVDVISEDPKSHEKFEVDGESGVEIKAMQGKKVLSHFIMGKSRSGMTFARLPGKDEVIRLQGYHENTFRKSVNNLRNKIIVKRDVSEIEKVKVEKGEETLGFEFQGEGAERKLVPIDREIENFDEQKATGMVRSLSSLSATEFVDEPLPPEKTGLGEGASKLTILSAKDSDEKPVTVFIGSELEEEQFYVKSTDSDQIFLVASSRVKRMLVEANDFARTDEELKEEEERQKQAAQNPPPGMGGMPGNQQIPPDVMRQLQAQMAQQKPGN